MYRIILSLIIIIFVLRLIWISRSQGWDLSWWKRKLSEEMSKLYKRIMLSGYKGNIYIKLRYFFISISLLSFFILAFTGIIPVVILNEHITGIFLITHVTIAPVFVVALAMTALFWAQSEQFNLSDLQFIKDLREANKDHNLKYNAHPFWSKVYFWLFLALSVPASLSMIFSMFPYFGTEGQNTMFNIHQCTTTGLLIVALLYTEYKLVFSKKYL